MVAMLFLVICNAHPVSTLGVTPHARQRHRLTIKESWGYLILSEIYYLQILHRVFTTSFILLLYRKPSSVTSMSLVSRSCLGFWELVGSFDFSLFCFFGKGSDFVGSLSVFLLVLLLRNVSLDCFIILRWMRYWGTALIYHHFISASPPTWTFAW